jgi:S-adenosylmethionine-dependent methyltransferase
MKGMTTNPDVQGFETEAEKYAAYLKTPAGRLRLDLPFANLQELLPRATESLYALDLGAGTGANAVRLARLGIRVALLDTSRPMLHLAERGAQEAGVLQKVLLKQGDVAEVAKLFDAGSFDVVFCHNILEFVDDPGVLLRDISRLMRASAILSVLVRNQAGEVLNSALQTGDLAAAETGLIAEWGQESLYGGKVRLFTAESLKAMLKDASLTPVAEHGVRVLADYLPPQISRSAEYDRIFALERELGRRREFAAVARYIQCLARPMGRQ